LAQTGLCFSQIIVSARDVRLGVVRAAVCAAAFALMSCAQPVEPPAGDVKARATESTATPSDDKVAESMSLGTLPDAVARLEALREGVGRALAVDGAEQAATAQLDASLQRIGSTRESLKELPLDELVETARRLDAAERVGGAHGSDRGGPVAAGRRGLARG
jgi:hypothetical protein